jgi:hypothetical protein
MKSTKNTNGSILSFAAGAVVILLVGVLGAVNMTYLVGKRFQLQSELDFLALQLVQQIDYENYFEVGFTDSLALDLDAIDQQLDIAQQGGALANCVDSIALTAFGLQVNLTLNCAVRLPAPIVGLPEQVVFKLASSARLAQADG